MLTPGDAEGLGWAGMPFIWRAPVAASDQACSALPASRVLREEQPASGLWTSGDVGSVPLLLLFLTASPLPFRASVHRRSVNEQWLRYLAISGMLGFNSLLRSSFRSFTPWALD